MDATQHVLTIFERLSAIPRGSGREAQISGWLQALANERDIPWQVDDYGNLLIRVPATPGRETAPVIVLQGHLDMVCEKTPDSPHNFLEDPIHCIVDGDWLHADRTTLGADNGIAIALALALASDPSVAHPALELLFTVQEEVSMGGADQLKPGFIKGKILINLDSEDEGSFIIGCAGGQTTHIRLPLALINPTETAAFRLQVSGLRGGHSGLDIHKHYASANKLLARVLDCIQQLTPLGLMSLTGGTAHNAISREGEAIFVCASGQVVSIQQTVREFETILKSEYAPIDGDIRLSLTPVAPGLAASQPDSRRVIQLLMALPHGVAEMSSSVEGFVETSTNLARIEIDTLGLNVVTFQRSTVMTRLQELTARITSIAQLAGAEVSSGPANPSWQPNLKSPLLQHSVETYQNLFGRAPEVRMLHAGLECGTIGAIYPELDMISLGATIENPHSPIERMYIPSIERVWRYLVTFLETVQ